MDILLKGREEECRDEVPVRIQVALQPPTLSSFPNVDFKELRKNLLVETDESSDSESDVRR